MNNKSETKKESVADQTPQKPTLKTINESEQTKAHKILEAQRSPVKVHQPLVVVEHEPVKPTTKK